MGGRNKHVGKITKVTFATVLCAISSVFAFSPAYADNSLIGYWNFDESSGNTIADSSGNANDGTITGSGVVHSTNVPPITCYNDPESLSFDGSGGYVSVPDNATMDPTSQISISFWMNANTVSNGYQHIIFKQGPVVTSYGVWLNGNHVYMEDNDNTVRSLTSNAVVTTGTWYYITVTYDGTTQKLYINGALDNSQSLPGITLSYENSPLKIGSGDYNNPFSGYIDDLRIYGRALTASEVSDLAGGGCGPGVSSSGQVVNANGLTDATEDASPNNGDANDDGVQDSQQANVASFVDDQTGKYVSVATASACTLTGLSTTPATSNAKPDVGYTYPAGLINYTANCGTPGYTATVQLYVYGVTASNLVLRKYNPTTESYATVPGAAITQATIGGQEVVVASYQVTDGGPLDADGTTNGVIVDPVGLAVLNTPVAPTSTLTDTGYDIVLASTFSSALIVLAVSTRFSLRRR